MILRRLKRVLWINLKYLYYFKIEKVVSGYAKPQLGHYNLTRVIFLSVLLIALSEIFWMKGRRIDIRICVDIWLFIGVAMVEFMIYLGYIFYNDYKQVKRREARELKEKSFRCLMK